MAGRGAIVAHLRNQVYQADPAAGIQPLLIAVIVAQRKWREWQGPESEAAAQEGCSVQISDGQGGVAAGVGTSHAPTCGCYAQDPSVHQVH